MLNPVTGGRVVEAQSILEHLQQEGDQEKSTVNVFTKLYLKRFLKICMTLTYMEPVN